LNFSHLEPSVDYVPSGPGELSPSESDASTLDSINSATNERCWTSPRVTFTFSTKDAPFPIDIETPFESFRTVLWRVYINRSPRSRDPAGLQLPCTQGYNKSLVTKGLERVSLVLFPYSWFQPFLVSNPITPESGNLRFAISHLLLSQDLTPSHSQMTPVAVRPFFTRNSYLPLACIIKAL
jgi:hypothetical protein